MIRVFELMAHESSASKTTSDQMMGLNVFSFFGEKNCSSISQKKKRNILSNGKQSQSRRERRTLISGTKIA